MRIGRLLLVALAIAVVSCRESDLAGPQTETIDALDAAHAAARGTPPHAGSPGGKATSASASTSTTLEDDDIVPDLDSVARYTSPRSSNGAEKVTVLIGPGGGSIRLHDFEVVVPAGAVDREMSFSIRILPEPARESHAWASFSPHNHQFNVPVTLRVPYQSTESAGASGAHVLWWNSGSWTELPTTLTPDGRLETQTNHFSKYATQRRGITMVGG